MKVKRLKKIRRFMSLLCVLAMIAGLINPVALKKSAVEVHAAEPGAIEISTPEELQKIGKDSAYPMSGDYVLTADIDLDGINFEPIGGTEGSKGATSGANVFSGTFDGQGHMISNLTIDITKTQNAPNYAQIGMFSVIASEDANDYAVVKNIVFANVHITTNISGNCTAAGTLAGEVNGYSTVENIAVLDGTVYINGSNQADTVGAGGVIGECRTEASMGNNYITIKNIYNGAEVLAGSSGNAYLAGGIIGRIRTSSCKEISGCVNVGRTSYKGELASAITAVHTGADDSCISDCYFLFATGSPSGEGTSELEEATLKSGILPTGLDPEVWYAAEGSYPLLQICKNEGPAGYLGLSSLAPEFADGENATCVTQDFTLPDSVGDIAVTWTSSNTDVITVEGTTAKVKGVLSPTKVVLTAATAEGVSRKYTITVISNVTAQFDQIYAKAGTPLTVSVTNAPADMNLTYAWSVGDEARAAVTGNSYTPTAEDNEKFIKVVITATNYDASWEVSMYMSDLPVVYIDTEDGDDVMNKDLYEYANIKIQGNDQFPTEDVLYDGLTEIKGRGNSTWDYAAANGLKKPYRLKFDGKADVLGMGKSKHWVLLANAIDHTNMRNELVYQFAADIGMECVLEFEPCVVILNGEYRGFYQIGEHKRVDEGRIDVFNWEALGEDIAGAIAKAEGFSDDETSDIEEYVAELDYSWLDTGVVNYKGKSYTVSDYYKGTIPEFTGGFAFDMDFRLYQSKFISKFYTDYGYPMFFEAPEYAKTSPTMMSFAQTYLQAFENAIHDDDYYAEYDGEEVHYSELFDVPSLLQNWFVVEYTMNWDAMKNSTLMYKDLDTEEGRSLMKMGPVWDFDWGWGNINMFSMTGPYVLTGWHTTQDSFCEQSYQWENWNRYLVSDPYFAMLAYEEWDNVRAVIEDMIKDGGRIDQLEEYYRAASEANDAKWASTYGLYRGYGVTDGRVTYKNSEVYADAVNSMEYFIETRVAWFDQQFTSVEDLLASWGRYQGSNTLTVADVQFPEEGTTEITAAVTDSNIKKIAFYVNGIRAGQADVADNAAAITVTDDMLRASAAGEELSNCVQIRAMDADGNFLKNGSAVVTNYGIFEKAVIDESAPDETTDTVVINEVESSDAEGGNDWVEIYNKGDEAVDISGWFVTDDKGLDRLTAGATTPLPEGTVLEPGAFLVLEENVNFTCGLGSGDTVYLYDANSNQVDTATWGDHAAGTVSRVPDGTGAFIDQAPSKGITNNPVVINEIESSDPYGGNDWVEIYNKSDKAVDISGWFVTDDKGLDRLTSGATTPLPDGTVLEAGAFLVLEENVNFTCGLGSGDTVYLYDAEQTLIDIATWGDHAEGTVAKVPDGTGAFVDQASTKGVSNTAGSGSGYVNKDGLQSAVNVAETLTETHYTEATWAVLEAALAEAKDVLAKENATQEEVDAAAAALLEAQDGLEETPVDDSVVINEIESSDANDGNDWVEIYNKSDKAVDISGWFVTDDKGLERLTSNETTPLPEGTVLQPGAVYVLEETVNFTCGLGGADTVYLYNADNRVVDSCTWSEHAAEALARVPDGTGAFVDQAPTKGALNIPTVLVEEILLDFTFDDEETGFKGGQAVAQPAGTLVDVDGRKALYLNGRSDNWLNVTKEDGSSLLAGIEEMTISYDIKTNGSLWAFYAAPNTNAQIYLSEHYIGILDNRGVVTVERYNSTNEDRPQFNTAPIPYGEWVHVEVTLGKDSTSIKINDGEAVVQEGLHTITDILGESPILQIGKGNWNAGEYFTGYLDNYKITTMVEEPVVILPYEDVAEDAWYYDVVYYNYVAGYMTGKSATIFAPDATLTRAELTSILYRINGEPEVAYEAVFTDVPADAWYASSVLWAYENKVVSGYAEGDFRPDNAITREQLAVIMHNYATAKGYATNSSTELDAFNDADQVGDWAKPAVQWAVATGVISGKNGVSLDPQGNATRAEAAAIIQRFMENIAK